MGLALSMFFILGTLYTGARVRHRDDASRAVSVFQLAVQLTTRYAL